ncbi:hypothetical protein HY837_00215, partial [archaeon]|nr:hypothetical protein [archaeon]
SVETLRTNLASRRLAEAFGGPTPQIKKLLDANPPIQVYVVNEKRIVFKVRKEDQVGALIAQAYEKANGKKGEDLVSIVDNQEDLEHVLSDAKSDIADMQAYFKQLPSVYSFVTVPKERHVVTGDEGSKKVNYTGRENCVMVKDPYFKGESPIFKIAGENQIICVNYDLKPQTVSSFESYLLRVQRRKSDVIKNKKTKRKSKNQE